MAKVNFQSGDRVVVKSDCNSKGETGTVTGECKYPDWYEAKYIIVKLDNGTSQNYNSKSLKKLNSKEEERKTMNDMEIAINNAIYNSSMNYYGFLKDNSRITNNKFDKDTIKDVIFNDPATIVLWTDGSKTVVKCQTETGDTYNKELGLAMCIIKKCCGNKGNYNDVFSKWIKE